MNKTNHQTQDTHMNTSFLRWKPNSGENHRYYYHSLQYLLYKENFLQFMLAQTYTITQAPACRKDTTFSHLPATTRRELQPPH